MIKVLQVVPGLVGGGVESLLLNYYKHTDRTNIKFDFIVFGSEIGAFESVFEELGSEVFHIPSRHESLCRSFKGMERIIKEGKYDIVHAHQNEMSFIPLYFAKHSGIRVRIAHSHTSFRQQSNVKKFVRNIFSVINKHYATDLFACSFEAGKWVFGKKVVNQGKVHILNNAIDVQEFIFSEEVRINMRNKLKVENKFVVGNVGRLSPGKNHEFLIQIFSEIHKANSNAILLIVGGGILEESIKAQVHSLSLDDSVLFLGVRKDVPKLMQAIDVFLLPTMFEGFGIAYLEAQAAGLVCFGTDKVVPNEVGITENMHFISIDKSSKYWADEVLKFSGGYTRKVYNEEIRNHGYDILQQAKILEVFYEKRVCE